MIRPQMYNIIPHNLTGQQYSINILPLGSIFVLYLYCGRSAVFYADLSPIPQTTERRVRFHLLVFASIFLERNPIIRTRLSPVIHQNKMIQNTSKQPPTMVSCQMDHFRVRRTKVMKKTGSMSFVAVSPCLLGFQTASVN